MQEQYAVPKHKFEAKVDFSDGDSIDLTLFLSEGAAGHMGPERPSDVLNGPSSFLPAINDQGSLVLVNCDMVRIARVPETSEFGPDEVEGDCSTGRSMSRVSIVMEDGTVLEGSVTYMLPRAKSRLQDYLNSNSRFILVRGEGAVRFVNRRFISRVIPMETQGGSS